MTNIMTSENLNGLKGWPSKDAVDFSAVLDPTDKAFLVANNTYLPAGAVVHIDQGSRSLKIGVPATAGCPMFTFIRDNDPSVDPNGPDPATTPRAYVPMTPSGKLTCIVYKNACELQSTHFDAALTASYLPGVPLTSRDITDVARFGMLVPTTEASGETIVGYVSRGVVNNGYGYPSVAFWPEFVPGIRNN